MPALSLSNLPHTVVYWKQNESVSTGTTKRIQTPTYTNVRQNVPCWMEPVSAKQKADIGYAFDQNIYRHWTTVNYASDINSGDVIRWGAHAYKVHDWVVYDEGAATTQHIEALCERMPSVPDGVT